MKKEETKATVVKINPTDYFSLNVAEALKEFEVLFSAVDLPFISPLGEELPLSNIYIDSLDYLTASLRESNTDTTVVKGCVVGYDKDEIIRVFEELALEQLIENIKYEDRVDSKMTEWLKDPGEAAEEDFRATLGSLNVDLLDLSLAEGHENYESIVSLDVPMSTLVICNALWDEIYETASATSKKAAEELIKVRSVDVVDK